MTLAVLLLLAIAIAGAVAALAWRWTPHVDPNPPAAMEAAREAGGAIRRHPGLGLTLALIAIVGGGAVLAVLAYLIRGNTELVRLDESVAGWGDRHASAFSTDGLNAVTHLGQPVVVVALAAILAAVETVRTRSAWVVPFLLIVVAGNGILTTTVKELADRVRPALNPVAETLGPSFPSGHSSWAAAFFAAAALLLSRRRGRHARAVIAGAAGGLVVTVAGSRVLLDVHWLSDVIAGVALGLAWFSICAIAFGGRLLRLGAAGDEARVAGDSGLGTRPAPSLSRQGSR